MQQRYAPKGAKRKTTQTKTMLKTPKTKPNFSAFAKSCFFAHAQRMKKHANADLAKTRLARGGTFCPISTRPKTGFAMAAYSAAKSAFRGDKTEKKKRTNVVLKAIATEEEEKRARDLSEEKDFYAIRRQMRGVARRRKNVITKRSRCLVM